MTTTIQRRRYARTKTALAGIAVAVSMVGLAYAAVPLYRIFCQVTGFAGTTQRAVAAPDAETLRGLAGRQINVRFDGNVRGLPWQFFPVENQMRVKIGEQNIAYFRAANASTTRTTGTATFNVTPLWAGKYFVKMQCFCFNEQTLAPGHKVDMPVVYYVDPAILDDPDARNIDEITLSYSFYPVEDPKHAPAIRATGEQMAPARIVG
ncbi:MAG: cytochrome c oxidase assembly protein [Sphingomonadaceae bacterium]